MANALEQKFNEMRRLVRTGPVGKFFSWWVEELKLALPEPWQEKLKHATRRLTVSLEGESFELGVDENRQLEHLGSLPSTPDTELQGQQIEDLRNDHDLSEVPVFCLLDASTVLSREMTLPSAAEANLSQVLSFEMDRQTPFKASAVYFDWEVLERGGAGGQIRLMLHVVPRPEVDEALRKLGSRGLELSGVDIRDGNESRGLNFLPEEQRFRVVNRKARVNWTLAGTALVLLVVTMAFSLYLRQHQVTELENAIADVRDEAMQVDSIRKQISGASDAAGFLATRRAESPLAVELLADITSILPDDTYLDRLVIGRNSVQLQGKSRNAQQLIEMVNESPYMSAAAFRGSTRLDARTGLEIFEINAQVSAVGGEDVPGS